LSTAGAVGETRNAPTRDRRRPAIVLALALLIAVLSLTQGDAANAQTKSARKCSVTSMVRNERRLAATINVTRKRHGFRTLRLVPGLMRSASKHSQQMAIKGYFAHSSPNGASFFTRIRKFFGGNISAGENLLWAAPRMSPRQVVRHWLASPEHRNVLLSRRWRVFGVGVVSSAHGAGVFKGRKVMLVTADFAVRR
jgi:uncharacterized protein YkwD